MPSLTLILLVAGMLGTLLLVCVRLRRAVGAQGSRPRRLESVRERHSRSTEVAAQAQLQADLRPAPDQGCDGFAQRFIPNPALLRSGSTRPAGPGRSANMRWPRPGSSRSSSLLLMFKGVPLLLALPVGLFVGIGLPHFVVGKLIKRRVNKFTARFPDAIELMVRGLRSGLPISETIGIVADEIHGPVGDEFRAVSDKMKIGRTMDAALQETADRLGTPEFQFFVITPRDPARDRRQPRRDARRTSPTCCASARR